MPYASDPCTLVLHGLRLKGFAAIEQLAEAAGMSTAEVRGFLDSLCGEEMVMLRVGRVSGWALTPGGRQREAEAIAAELDRAGLRESVANCYSRFLEVNSLLLQICTDWQMRTVEGRQVVNDHRDDAHDRAVISRLRAVDEEIQPVCAALADGLSRFHTYGPRLSNALKKVESGDTDWFTRPIIDSYHTVWFELHEDLLSTLGVERARESAS